MPQTTVARNSDLPSFTIPTTYPWDLADTPSCGPCRSQFQAALEFIRRFTIEPV